MSDWTTGPEEYEHVRKLILDAPFGEVVIYLKNGKIIQGFIVGQGSGTDVGQNMDRGAGPVVTKMWAELKVRLSDGSVVVVSVRDIARIEQKTAKVQ